MEDNPTTGPLSGIRVLDLSNNLVGPLAAMILGDMGADVLKIEPPSGDPMRHNGPCRNVGMASMFMSVNRNKRSIVLDLKRAESKDPLKRLVRSADVVINNMRAEATKRLGIDYESLSAENPRLVYAVAAGFSSKGRYAGLPAYDDIIQAGSGLSSIMEEAIGASRYFPTLMVDKLCGIAMAGAIAMALTARNHTGRGDQVTVPMLETMVQFNLFEHIGGAFLRPPGGKMRLGRMMSPYHRPLDTSDGRIGLVAQTDAQWSELLDDIGRPDLINDPRFATFSARVENSVALYEAVSEALRWRPTAEWLERFQARNIPCGPETRLEDLQSDPHLRDVGLFVEQEHPTEGPITQVGVPIEFLNSPGSLRRPVPTLGEHTREVLREAGYGEAEIDALVIPYPQQAFRDAAVS